MAPMARPTVSAVTEDSEKSREGHLAQSGNGTDISNSECESVVIIIWFVGLEKVVFQKRLAQEARVHVVLRSKFNVESANFAIMETTEGNNGIFFGVDGMTVNLDNAGTTNFVGGGLVGGEQLSGTAVLLDALCTGTIVDLVFLNSDAEGGVGTVDSEELGQGMGEGVGCEVEFVISRMGNFCRKKIVLLQTLQVGGIGRCGRNGGIIRAFVKSCMFSSLGSFHFRVPPKQFFVVLGRNPRKSPLRELVLDKVS